jgi:hypothetical protein
MGNVLHVSKNTVKRLILSHCLYNEYFRRDLADHAAKQGMDSQIIGQASDHELERALLRVLNGEDFRLEVKG